MPSMSLERRRAAALGGGGRAGRDGDAVDIFAPQPAYRTANLPQTQYNEPHLHDYLHQRGYVFTHVCLSVCLSVFRSTELLKKLLIKSLWNFTEWLDMIQSPID